MATDSPVGLEEWLTPAFTPKSDQSQNKNAFLALLQNKIQLEREIAIGNNAYQKYFITLYGEVRS